MISENRWPDLPRIPRGAAAALAALHFRDARSEELAKLSDAEWRQALNFTDRSQLTLALRNSAAHDAMPQWAREQTAGCAAGNLERLSRAEQQYRALDQCLKAAGVDYLALKGLTHCPEFGATAADRMQYDIDLYTPGDYIYAARDAVISMGFTPLESAKRLPTDHLPALIRKTGWEWRGDFFDPEIPFAVEIHFQFWNHRLERLPAPGVEEFWPRRVTRQVAGVEMNVLSRADSLAFAALHLLKHVLQGSCRSFHVYEIARFLEANSADDAFWNHWRALHPPELRRLQAVMFRLAQEWFGCRVSEAAAEEMERLPAATQRWFDEYACSPVQRIFHPAKDELWLHLSLLPSAWDALAIVRRRVLPVSLPGPVDAIHIPENQLTPRRRLQTRIRYLRHIGKRMTHHARTLAPLAWSGFRWWWKPRAPGGQFWTFLGAAVLYNFAFFVFVLLYNLRLLELGYREDFLGLVSSAGTIGCLVGTLPAAALVRRWGLRRSLLITIAASACIAALRALATGRVALAVLAFIGGVVFSGWAVIMAPAVAGAVPEARRPAAFSFFYATMFSAGIAGGWVGGRLPLWVQGRQAALLIAAGLVASALLPASRLQLGAPAPETASKKVYPRSEFMVRYLISFAIWNLAIGSFNPFFNAYFARLGFGADRIGVAFSTSQLAQVGAVLLSPLLLRKAGLANGITGMMIATAVGLLGLAAHPTGGAVAAYCMYMAFQSMSEPWLSALLMNRVDAAERGGAAALNYLVMFAASALAALIGGSLVSRFGYAITLSGSAGLACLAAACFQMLLRERRPLVAAERSRYESVSSPS